MSHLKTLYFLQICALLIITIHCKTEWIDPFSMEDDPTINTECECPSVHSSSVVASHYIRTISLLLNSLRYDTVNNVHNALYEVNFAQEDYDFIRTFLASAMDDNRDWDRVDKIFTSMLVNREDTYLMTFFSWKDYLFNVLSSKETGICVGIMFIIWVLYKAKHANLTVMTVVKYLALCFYLIDFIYTWIYMLKEKEVEQLLHITYKVPPECDVKKMGWSQFFAYLGHTFVGNDKCEEYHKIKDIDIFWTVSPSQVIGTQLGNMILAPADKIGSAFGKLTNAVMDKSSWYLMIPTMLMLPMLLFGLLIAGCVFLSFVTGRVFSFNFFHIIQFAFGKSDDSTSRNSPQPQQINLLVPPLTPRSRQKRLRLREEKKTSKIQIQEAAKAQAVPAIKQEIEEIPVVEKEKEEDLKESLDGNESSSSEESVEVLKRCESDEYEYEVIG